MKMCPRCGGLLHISEHPKGYIYSCWQCPYVYIDAPGYESQLEKPVKSDK